MTLPTGTVTFLFTDVERSTQTVESVGDERYADMQEQHRKLLREAFVAHNGVEVGTEGDAFFVAFATATDGVNAAIEGQRTLAEHSSLRVRMGLHTGEALVRDGDYVGHEVHRAKRVSDAGHGGQILLSQTTADLVGSRIQTKDLGSHRLKDLGEPQRLFQVDTPGLECSFPHLRTLELFRHNLPAQRTSFIGRTKELAAIKQELSRHRLVTLTGVGGCGKTRLASQVAADLVETFPAGVYFIDLARVTDGDALVGAITAAMGITSQTFGTVGSPPIDEVVRAFATEDGLIVLDNCEHLIDAAAHLADGLLSSCPPLRIIATSREALEVEGEQSFTVPSLAVPETDDDTTSHPAVELFCDRAYAVRPDFVLTEESRAAVAEIARRLDGVPLALELAAAQVAHLSPVQIAQRLHDRFRLLTGGRRRIQRQQTLGATLDWSYDLLSEDERTLLRRVAVFPGSFSLGAAEAICNEGMDAPIVTTLGSLVRKSLVDVLDEGDEVRYRTLETVRLYAEDKLLGSGESEAVRTRHATYYRNLLAFGSFGDIYAPRKARLVVANAHNLRAAIAWSSESGDITALADLLLIGMPLWAGSFDEPVRWLRVVLASRDEFETGTLGGLLMLSAWVAGHRTRWFRAYAFAEEAIELAGPDPEPFDWLSVAYAFQAVIQSFEALDGVEGAAEIARERIAQLNGITAHLVPALAAYAYTMIGSAQLNLGEPESAVDSFRRAVETYDDHNDPNVPMTYNFLASTLCLLGRPEDALPYAERAADSRALWRQFSGSPDPGWDVSAGVPKVLVLGMLGRYDEARRFATELVSGAENTRVARCIGNLLLALATIAQRRGDHSRAVRLLGHIPRTTGGAIVSSLPECRLAMDGVRAVVASDEFERLLAEGAAMSQPEAIAYGIEGIDA